MPYQTGPPKRGSGLPTLPMGGTGSMITPPPLMSRMDRMFIEGENPYGTTKKVAMGNPFGIAL